MELEPVPTANGRKFFHFGSSPGAQPKEILRVAQSEMLNWRGSGLSVMEMSHRGKEFRQIADKARESLRTILSIPDNFEIFFTQGGPEM